MYVIFDRSEWLVIYNTCFQLDDELVNLQTTTLAIINVTISILTYYKRS